MDGHERGGGAEFDSEVAIANRVHGILRNAGFILFVDEAEELRDEFTIERDGGAGDGAAAERADVGAIEAIFHAAAVALEHFAIGEEVMGEEDGLGALQMRVAGNDDVDVVLSEIEKSILKGFDFFDQ